MRTISRSPSGVVAIVAAFGMSLGAADLTAQQQSARIARIGFLHPGTPPNASADVFRNALQDLGYIEGRDVTIEFRWAEGHMERLSPLAAELIALKVDVIVVGTTPAIKAVAEKTKTIPIVMTVVADPVADGLVQSLGHPGGNVTGLTIVSPELSGKRIELLKEAVPKLSRLAVLWNPANPTHPTALRESQATAKALGLQTVPVPVEAATDVDGAFATIARERASALFVLDDVILFIERERIAHLALKHRLPLVSGISGYADAGGLLTYGARQTDLYLRAAVFVDRILKGARPANLPIEHPSSFELVLNLKTAKSLGVLIPDSVRWRADRLIE
jgi:putative tryptophan/tyrosine transport system substrate-binding protein